MDVGRLLIAGGLTVWFAGLVAAAAYLRRRMRFPKSRFAGDSAGAGGAYAVIPGLLLFAATAFSFPTVAWVFTLFASGLVIYVLGAYAVALTVERGRAIRLGLPEPGTAGSTSFAESAVFLAVALPFALAALILTIYGVANELGANRAEGVAALGLGAAAWFIAIVMAVFASPLLGARWRD